MSAMRYTAPDIDKATQSHDRYRQYNINSRGIVEKKQLWSDSHSVGCDYKQQVASGSVQQGDTKQGVNKPVVNKQGDNKQCDNIQGDKKWGDNTQPADTKQGVTKQHGYNKEEDETKQQGGTKEGEPKQQGGTKEGETKQQCGTKEGETKQSNKRESGVASSTRHTGETRYEGKMQVDKSKGFEDNQTKFGVRQKDIIPGNCNSNVKHGAMGQGSSLEDKDLCQVNNNSVLYTYTHVNTHM